MKRRELIKSIIATTMAIPLSSCGAVTLNGQNLGEEIDWTYRGPTRPAQELFDHTNNQYKSFGYNPYYRKEGLFRTMEEAISATVTHLVRNVPAEYRKYCKPFHFPFNDRVWNKSDILHEGLFGWKYEPDRTSMKKVRKLTNMRETVDGYKTIIPGQYAAIEDEWVKA